MKKRRFKIEPIWVEALERPTYNLFERKRLIILSYWQYVDSFNSRNLAHKAINELRGES